MGEQVLSARVSVNKGKLECFDARRISLPAFSSDLGKEIPNYLRASIGSCHDFCKYGKETASVRQNRPWIKNGAAASNVGSSKDVPKVKCAKVPKINASNKKSEILSEANVSEYSVKLNEKEIKPAKEFPTTSESKLLNTKSLAKKTGVTSGSVKLEKLKRIVPTNVGSPDGGRNSLNHQVVGKRNENKSISKIINRSSARSKHDTVTKSPIHPPKKLNAITRPPLSPAPSKLATKAKTPSTSTPPPLTPTAKSRPRSSPNQLKAKSVAAHSPASSDTKKTKAATLKAPPPFAPRNASIKKDLKFKDQNAKKGVAPKTGVSKPVAARLDSLPYKSKTATKLKGIELQPEKMVDAEAKESHEREEDEPSHAAELGKQEVMESYDEVPEKTLYVIEMETGNISKPSSCDEDDAPDMQLSASLLPPHWPTSSTHSSSISQHEGVQCELTNTDKTPPSAEKEISDMQPLESFSFPIQPTSPSSIAESNKSSQNAASKDDSTYTESEVDTVSREDGHLVDGGDLKGADNTKLKKSPTISSQEFNKDPVKLKFRRGKVVDVTQENNDGPRRLKFGREHVHEENTAQDEVRKCSFKRAEPTQDNATRENCSGTVALRHQDVKDKKDAQGLFNNVIEETANKLAETRKSKVKALVGAFETVISLQDGKPAATI